MHSTIDGPRVVGTKQTLKALQEGEVTKLFVAKDADPIVLEDALKLAKLQEIPIVFIETMELLGEACSVKVRTATAALIKH